jgi:hypothetical protein
MAATTPNPQRSVLITLLPSFTRIPELKTAIIPLQTSSVRPKRTTTNTTLSYQYSAPLLSKLPAETVMLPKFLGVSTDSEKFFWPKNVVMTRKNL